LGGLDELEQDFYAIFEKAKEYRARVSAIALDENKLYGGDIGGSEFVPLGTHDDLDENKLYGGAYPTPAKKKKRQ